MLTHNHPPDHLVLLLAQMNQSGEKERMYLFWLEERNDHPQELEEAGENHPCRCLFLSALPLTLPQYLGPEIEIASMKICLRDQATTLAMWWQ
jgi:hypothetical protein